MKLKKIVIVILVLLSCTGLYAQPVGKIPSSFLGNWTDDSSVVNKRKRFQQTGMLETFPGDGGSLGTLIYYADGKFKGSYVSDFYVSGRGNHSASYKFSGKWTFANKVLNLNGNFSAYIIDFRQTVRDTYKIKQKVVGNSYLTNVKQGNGFASATIQHRVP